MSVKYNSISTYAETLTAVGRRARKARLACNLTQSELGQRAGVGTATVQRFEKTGHSSLENVLRIAIALAMEGDFEQLFKAPPYASLDEALARPDLNERKRAGRRKRR